MIKIENLCIRLPGFTLDNINLSIKDREFFMLLGPTGSGKSMILEAIAGIRQVTGGSIKIKGKDITKLAPEQRGIGIMYQDYALFPHLSVMDNIKFGLRYHKSKSDDSMKWLKSLMGLLGLEHLAARMTTSLSGGEKQRIALARALAVKPSLLLLDEPLSALDPNFREDIRSTLKKIHEKSGITFLMVTHDFTEALYLGQRAAVIKNGKIEQTGTVAEIFKHPATMFVAEFVGMKNIFSATFDNGKAILDGLDLNLDASCKKDKKFIAVRPEDIMILKEKISENGLNVFQGKITAIIDKGPFCEISAKAGSLIFKTIITKSALFKMDINKTKNIYLALMPSDIHPI